MLNISEHRSSRHVESPIHLLLVVPRESFDSILSNASVAKGGLSYSNMQAQLQPLDGSRPIEIARDVSVVGRSSKLADIVLDHPSVSKLHCLLARTDGLLFFRDLASTNGTRVNGQKVTRGALLPGDELSFGRVKFRVFLGPGDTNHDDSEVMLEAEGGTMELDEFGD